MKVCNKRTGQPFSLTHLSEDHRVKFSTWKDFPLNIWPWQYCIFMPPCHPHTHMPGKVADLFKINSDRYLRTHTFVSTREGTPFFLILSAGEKRVTDSSLCRHHIVKAPHGVSAVVSVAHKPHCPLHSGWCGVGVGRVKGAMGGSWMDRGGVLPQRLLRRGAKREKRTEVQFWTMRRRPGEEVGPPWEQWEHPHDHRVTRVI